ncbi:MAG: ECF transporter S component [Clostridia bacterium]|nr:ECF transporter S component [Clostridia bacterium]
MKNKNTVKLIAGVGIFAALAIIVSFATSFVKVHFLSLDAGDIVIVLASFIYGVPSGVAISAISALVSFMYSGTGPWGMLMDFVSSAVFSFVASAIYRKRRSFKSAIIGIYTSVIAVTLVMIPMNILVTPLFVHQPTEVVIKLIPTLLLPFNLFKTLFNGGVALVIYKPLVRGMRAAKLIPPTKDEGKNEAPPKWLIPTLGVSSILIATAVLVLLSFVEI